MPIKKRRILALVFLTLASSVMLTWDSGRDAPPARQDFEAGLGAGERALSAAPGPASRGRLPSAAHRVGRNGPSELTIDPARLAPLIDSVREALARRSGAAAGAGASALRRERTSGRAVSLLEAGGVMERSPRTAEIAGVTSTRYRLHKQGRPVFNRTGILHERGGRLVGRAGSVSVPPMAAGPARMGRQEAAAAALRAAGVEIPRGSGSAELGFLATARATVPAWRVVVPAFRPLGTWQVILDARSGETLSLVDLMRRATGVGSVYDPNRALSPVPSDVPLERLDESGRLQGDVVRVFDARAPAAFRPDLAFRFPESDPRFTQTAVYHAVTRTGIFAEERGFPVFTEPLYALTNIVDPVTGGEFNNAGYFYDPFFQLLLFGNGDGVLTANLGTDFDVAAHETGHHLFEVLVQPEITSLLDPLLAMSEGVADTVAALVGGDPNVGESTLPGQPFLRTLANSASFPDGLADDPHETGLVYGGANWDLIQLLGADVFTELLFAALAQLPSDAFETDYRDAFLAANLTLRAGQNDAQIRSIFTVRGFDALDFPPEFEGFLDDGIPEARVLSDSPPDPDPFFWNVHMFFFSEFPGSTAVTFRTSGSSDVDLFVVSASDPEAFKFSENIGSNEVVSFTRFTQPSVDVGDGWIVYVIDYPDGLASAYSVTAEATLPPASISVGGAPLQGSLEDAGVLDLVTFQNSVPGRVVRVEARAVDATLDPVVVAIDPDPFTVLGGDDDSGPGNDALIQGARLATSGTYVLAVLALGADVDPTLGPGRYELRLTTCSNSSGPDSDGDSLRDACDDDDDDDDFIDSVDSAPLDPELCSDVDQDGCDDCSSGDPDPFQDGTDTDLDAICDLGDPDDDNDGCVDEGDSAPLQASADDDFDFLGAHCDNCPSVANPDQSDSGTVASPANPSGAGADGTGDACSCGDVSGDGKVLGNDATLMRRFLLNLSVPASFRVSHCNVAGSPGSSAAECQGNDATVVRRALLGLGPGLVAGLCLPAAP